MHPIYQTRRLTNFVAAGKILRKKIKEKRQKSHLILSLSQDYISLISGSLLDDQEERA